MGAFAHAFGMLQNRLSGTGKFWRDRSDRSIEEDARAYEQLLTFDPPPPGFKPEQLGHLLLVFFEDDTEARILNIWSALSGIPGRANDMKWRGMPLLTSPVIQSFGYDNELDLQRFLHFVYNYKYILFDTKTKGCWPAHPEDVSRILYGNSAIPDMRLLAGALGGR